MPGPLDYLKRAGSWATTPLLPQEAIEPVQTAMTEPHLDENPILTRVKGFGAGALEGLRGLTTPVDIASLAIGGPEVSAARRASQLGTAAESLPALGRVAAEFAPVGEEAAYNIGRQLPKVADPMEAAYQNVLSNRGGLMGEAGKASPEMIGLLGGAGAGLAYAGKSLYDKIKGKAGEMNDKLNPYQRMANELDPSKQNR